ncbi:hypothetical protein EOL70_15925 [Leucothrix sargassi]|nr:hypothetical protein EOL70_15925 [Leucothrix sargassi]
MHRLQLKLQQTIRRITLLTFALSCLLVFSQATQAHEEQPAIAVIQVQEDGVLTVNITTHLEAMIMGGAPDHDSGDFKKAAQYLKLRKLSPTDLTLALNDFTSELLAGIEIRADNKLLITSLESSVIPEPDMATARESVIHLKTKLPADAQHISWRWKESFGLIALRLHSPTQQDVFNAYLEPGVQSQAFELAKLKD